MTDDTWYRDDSSYGVPLHRPSSSTSGYREVSTPLQPLDARSLLAARLLQECAQPRARSAVSSTPPSSLDLEWEHDVCLPVQAMHFAPPADDCSVATGRDGATATGPSSAAWSRVSSPDSLEWDPAEAPLCAADQLDLETEQLLGEIERLTSRALRETGDWTS
ncbi:uncharacterized protein LOC134528359 isoform X2 [Bacillus rossius redtenbacheri]